jgi:hypothetical protein
MSFFPETNVKRPFDKEIAQRDAKVLEIIDRHLTAIHEEVLVLDPQTLNIDDARDKARIAQQVLAALVEQLRGFGCGARASLAAQKEDEEEDEELLSRR